MRRGASQFEADSAIGCEIAHESLFLALVGAALYYLAFWGLDARLNRLTSSRDGLSSDVSRMDESVSTGPTAPKTRRTTRGFASAHRGTMRSLQ
jgi:hypothetical protein